MEYSSKVIIPKSLRKEMLARVHEGHLGLAKCKEKARTLMFWPGMATEINEMIGRCETCKCFAYRQPSEPLMMRPTPSQPWERVGVDLCQYAGKSYLVVYDAYSNFPEVEHLLDTTASTVVSKLSSIFARHGIPVEVNSDNGPQFVSREFRVFASKYEFKHVTSSPGFPQSNGLAEKGVQVVKRLMKKTNHANEDFYLGLLNYRSSPLEGGKSPSELLMGRRIRSRIPDFTTRLHESVVKHKQKEDRGKRLPDLQPGDVVRVRHDDGWTAKAQVENSVAPRSYKIITQDGREFRRNRQHLLTTSETFDAPDNLEGHAASSQSTEVPTSPAATHQRAENTVAAAPANLCATERHATPRQQRCTGIPVRTSARLRQPPRHLGYARNFKQIP